MALAFTTLLQPRDRRGRLLRRLAPPVCALALLLASGGVVASGEQPVPRHEQLAQQRSVPTAEQHRALERRGPTPEQKHALALIALPPAPLPGTDGYAALWLLHKNVPDEQLADWLARDEAWTAQQQGKPLQGTLPSASLPDLPGLALGELDCKVAERCLHKVRQNLNATQAWLDAQAPLLDRVQALAQYGHLRERYWRLELPMPRYELIGRPVTRFAVQFAQSQALTGDADPTLAAQREAAQFGAMQGLCRHSGTVQRLLGSGPQTLLPQMIAAANVQRSSRLLADMIAERAPDAPVPAECAQAFAPDPQAPTSMCRTMQGEWQWVQNYVRNLRPQFPWDDDPFGMWTPEAVKASFDNANAVRWMSAQQFAPHCEPAYVQAFARGERAALRVKPPAVDPLSCLAATSACKQGTSDWSSYADRLHDREAMRRAVAGLLWLRAQPGALSLAAREALWPQRPAELRWPGADAQWVWLNPERTQAVLRVPLWFTERGPHLDLAL